MGDGLYFLVIAYFAWVVGLVKDMWCSVNGYVGVLMDGTWIIDFTWIWYAHGRYLL
jgi:hypothetical protein